MVSEEDSEDYEEEETQEDYPDEGHAADEENTKKESDSGIVTLNTCFCARNVLIRGYITLAFTHLTKRSRSYAIQLKKSLCKGIVTPKYLDQLFPALCQSPCSDASVLTLQYLAREKVPDCCSFQ